MKAEPEYGFLGRPGTHYKHVSGTVLTSADALHWKIHLLRGDNIDSTRACARAASEPFATPPPCERASADWMRAAWSDVMDFAPPLLWPHPLALLPPLPLATMTRGRAEHAIAKDAMIADSNSAREL